MNLSEAISSGVSAVMDEPSTPMWMKALALMGGLYLVQSLSHTTGGIIVMGAYIVGFAKFCRDKIRELRKK